MFVIQRNVVEATEKLPGFARGQGLRPVTGYEFR